MPKRNYPQRDNGLVGRLKMILKGAACLLLVNFVVRRSLSQDQSKDIGVRGATTRDDVFNQIKTLQSMKNTPGSNMAGSSPTSDKPAARPSIFSKRTPALPATTGTAVDRSQPPVPGSKEYGLWKNKYGVVHVMHSRFMQLQPDLIELGKARIELFKTFTLRSFREQSTKDFLWIIFTDPELDPAIAEPLKELVKFDKNILIVGMNHNFHEFRNEAWMKGIQKVFSGDMQMLKDYHAVAQNHVYIETRIDMDDAMYQDFMRRIQGSVNQALGKTQRAAGYDASKYPETEFRVFCPEHHLEWGYFNPWDKESKHGHLYGLHSPNFCITAGLTHAYQVGTKPLEITGHHRLDKSYPQCRDKAANNTNCLDRVPDGKYKYVVLRSRTPTSAGMTGVLPAKEVVESTEWKKKQAETWFTYIFKNFGVTPKSVWDLRQKLSDNMEKIIEDAIKGQCTRADFTCKDASKKDLNTILEMVRKNDATSSREESVATE